MMKKKDYGLWLFPSLTAMVVIVGSLVGLVPQVEKIIESNRNIKQINQDLVKAERKIQQVAKLNTQEVSDLSKLFNRALPKEKPYFEVVFLLQQLGLRTGVVVGDFELNPGKVGSEAAELAKGDYVQLDTKLTFKGTTDQVADFIELLHESLPLMKVSQISISDDAKSTAGDLRSGQVELAIVYKAEAKQAKEVSLEPLPALPTELTSIRSALASYYDPVTQSQDQPVPLQNPEREDIFNF